MRLRRKSVGMVALCIAASGGASGGPQESSARRVEVPADPFIDARVRLSSDGTAEVELDVPLAWYRDDLAFVELAFRDVGLRGELTLASYVRSAHTRGAALPLRKEHPGARYVAAYHVVPGVHEAEPANGVDGVSHPLDGGFCFIGSGLFPEGLQTPDGRRLSLPVRLLVELVDPRLTLVTSLSRRGDILTAESLEELTEAVFYLAETVHTRSLDAAGAHIEFHSTSFDRDALESSVQLTRRTLETAHTALGLPAGDSHRYFQIFLEAHPTRRTEGGVLGSTVMILSPDAPSGRAMEADGAVIVHELLHLWNRGTPMWVGEGITRYLEILFRAHLDGLVEAQALSLLLATSAAHAALRQGPIQEAAGLEAYEGGAMVAFCLDAFLRKRDTSLFALHRDVRRSLGMTSSIDQAAIRARLTVLDPELATALDRWVTSDEPDFRPCFEAAGFEASSVSHRGYTARALAVDVLGVTGYATQTPEILGVSEGSRFQPHDRILRVEGIPVVLISAIEPILGQISSGEAEIELERSGEILTVALPLPRLRAEDRPARQTVVARSRPNERFLTGWD
ncbi:MAG: hypothetical protein AAGF12_10820 [Myxococcota bacterium]